MIKPSRYAAPRMMRDGQFSGESLSTPTHAYVRAVCVFVGFVIGIIAGAAL